MREVVSVPEAAEILGCSDVWVLKLIKSNQLEGFRLNGRAWAVYARSVRRAKEEYESRSSSHPGRPRRAASKGEKR